MRWDRLRSGKRRIVSFLLVGTIALFVGCGTEKSASSEIWGQADALEIDLNSKIPGYVVNMKVQEGEKVKAGQVLAHVDSRQLQAKANQANAQVQAGMAQLAQAKANLAMAEADKQRFTDLYAQDAVSRQAYEGYVTKYNVAVETYHQAQAAVAGYQQAVQEVDVNIEDTDIKSPLDGIVTTKYVNEGAMVSSGMPLYTVQNPQDNWVNFKIPETMLGEFSLGQKIKLVGRDGKLTMDGVISDISSKPDFATQRATSERGNAEDIIAFNVKVKVNDERVRPGMRFKMVDYTLPSGE